MATIVNNPDSSSADSNGGWIIAGVLIIVVALIAIFVWPGYAVERTTPEPAGTQINVEIPTPALDNGSDQGGTPSY